MTLTHSFKVRILIPLPKIKTKVLIKHFGFFFFTTVSKHYKISKADH